MKLKQINFVVQIAELDWCTTFFTGLNIENTICNTLNLLKLEERDPIFLKIFLWKYFICKSSKQENKHSIPHNVAMNGCQHPEPGTH